jgi:hypothetical protein
VAFRIAASHLVLLSTSGTMRSLARLAAAAAGVGAPRAGAACTRSMFCA